MSSTGTVVHRLLLLLLGVLLPAPLAAQRPTPSQVEARADAYLRAAVKHEHFSGSVLIAREGRILLDRGYGMANHELQVPNTPGSVYLIASLTKQFTAMAIMQLAEEGKLKVTDPICTHLPSCPDAWRPVTIRHLLTHTSGIFNTSRLPDWDERIGIQPWSRWGFLEVFRDLPLEFEPGSRFRYSNSGYYLLGLIIERSSGMPYENFLRARIFQPLGMTRTGMADSRDLVPGRSTGYYSLLDRFINAPYLNHSLPYASGGIMSTTGDLLRWDQALTAGRLVSSASLTEIFTPWLGGYAYGWNIERRFNRDVQGHSGSYNGYSSYLMRVPSERLTVIVLGNSDRMSATKAAVMLAAIALGEPYKLPEPSLYDLLAATAVKNGGEAAARQYRELKRTSADRYRFEEDLLNDLGYDLLADRRVQDAVTIFALNVEMYPQSANAHDSLGEGFAVLGDTTAAIASYGRALELDPALPSALRMMENLRRPAGEPGANSR